MAKKDDPIDEASPWNTPLSGAPKPKTSAEIDAAVASKPTPAPSASKAAGEPQREDYPDVISYNIAMKKWAQKQVGTPSVGRSTPTAKSISGK